MAVSPDRRVHPGGGAERRCLFTAVNHKNAELAQLQAIIGLKSRQITTWLRGREGDAQFLSGSRSFGELVRRWREEGDLASRQYLLDRLREHQQIYGYQSVWVLDERGEAILTTLGDAIPELTPPLRAAARRAIAEGRVVDTDWYRDGDDSTPPRLDFVAPLPRVEGGRPGPAIVLRTTPDQVLYPLLRFWPFSSASAPTRLFRREGDQVVFLEGPRPYLDADVRSRFPLTDKQLLAARALRGEAQPGGIVEGVDDRGMPAVGAVGPVPGRDWFLLAELTRSNLYSPVERDALWIGLMALLALFAAAAATYLIDQRRALRFSLLQGRQQAEKLTALRQLANERVRLRTLVRTIPDLIWLKDPEGRYLACNPAFERFFGAKEADIVGKTDYDFVSADLADFFRQKDREAIAAGGPRVNEESIPLAGTGGRMMVETIKTPMWDSDGELVGVLGIGRDITSRKRAEEELRFQAMVLNQIEDKVTVTDLQGIVTYVNEAGCRHLKRSREELIGQPVTAYGDDPARGATQQQIVDATLAAAEWRGEVVNQAADGAESILDCRTRVVRDEEGSPVALCGIATDITERKRTATELDRYRHHLEELVAERTAELAAARDEAEAASRAKSAFLANMSHEIRTPMNAVLGFAHLLRREVREAEGRRKVDKIVAAAEYLLGILNNVLDLSKIEAEKLALERVDFDLPRVVEEARALVADKARAKGLALTVELAPEAAGLGRVRGDPTRLRQMLLNYLSNAIKFTERGGIVLRGRLLAAEAGEWLLRFEVRDTGPGIAPDVLPRLFAAFEQADGSTTRRHGGTGLGLAINRRLARLMGGEVGVESQPGIGSVFWCTVRLGKSAAAVAPANAAAGAALDGGHHGFRLLLVEDNPINQEVALELLRGEGFAVDLAEDGARAVDLASRYSYDLILMDVQMPVMDGLDATRAIRRLPACERTPILATTANAFNEDRACCLDAGMDDHIGKPVEPEILFATLRKWLHVETSETI